jgi:hypothetical protein
MATTGDLQRHDGGGRRSGVKVEMIADVVGTFVEGPIVGEVAAGAQGSKLEDGLGAPQAPARAGDVHSVLDQVATGALDDTGSDRKAGGKILIVGQDIFILCFLAGSRRTACRRSGRPRG